MSIFKKIKLKSVIMVALAAVLGGGGGLQLAGKNPGGAFHSNDIKTAVRISTMLFIDNDVEKAKGVISVIQKTREVVDQHKEITISKATWAVRENIIWQNLDPMEAVLADAAIEKIEAAIDNEIKHKQISGDKIILVQQVLDWVEQSATLIVQ